MLKMGLFVEGILTPEDLVGLDAEKIERAAYQAINYAADRARTMSSEEIRKQINFPASYLNPSSGRLKVSDRAGPSSLEAIILGRHRATSLARFAVSGNVGKPGIDVAVKPGKSEEMKRAFLIKLKGSSNVDTARNLGLAIRVERGTVPSKAYKPVRISDGLYLLYGPSVNQIFQTVRSDVIPETERLLEREFLRLIERERN